KLLARLTQSGRQHAVTWNLLSVFLHTRPQQYRYNEPDGSASVGRNVENGPSQLALRIPRSDVLSPSRVPRPASRAASGPQSHSPALPPIPGTARQPATARNG